MKNFKLLTLLLFCTTLFFHGCKDKTESTKQETPEPQPIDFSKTPSQSSTEPTQNASGVYHYTCSNGCPGGAGSAVNCGTCGELLVHNQAYHSNSAQNNNPFNTPTPTAETGQNAAGIWHYSCSNGCPGGL